MPIPQLDTPEWGKEVRFFVGSTPQERQERARQLGILGASYERRMRERGVHTGIQQNTVIIEGEDNPVIKLPPVKLREYKSRKRRRGDEEEMGVVAGDGHAAKVTKSYNGAVYRRRMETMFDSIMVIAELHRNMYPIRKLRIFNVGDNLQGENVYQGSKLEEVEMGARSQITRLAAPCWNDLLGSLKQHFEEVEMDCYPGNHGKYGKEAPETSNWDLMLYDVLQQGIGQHKGITIKICDDPSGMGIEEMNGFRFLVFHGDAVRSINGIPLFALARRVDKWYQQFGGFNYAICGHFHKRINAEHSARVETFVNSTLVSDDPWALKRLGISSNPSQWAFGVHPKMGVTWRYGLSVDRDYLVEKLPDIYGGK